MAAAVLFCHSRPRPTRGQAGNTATIKIKRKLSNQPSLLFFVILQD